MNPGTKALSSAVVWLRREQLLRWIHLLVLVWFREPRSPRWLAVAAFVDVEGAPPGVVGYCGV